MSQELSALDLINKVKADRDPREDGGPKIAEDRVLILELVIAAEKAVFTSEDLSSNYATRIFDQLLRDLRSGTLVAKTNRDRHIIAPRSWPEVGSETKDLRRGAAYLTDFYHPVIMTDAQCSGMEGETPYVDIDDAVRWIEELNIELLSEPLKFETVDELLNWYKEQVAQFVCSGWPSARARDQMIIDHDGIPNGIKRSRARKVIRAIAEKGKGAPEKGRPTLKRKSKSSK